MTQSNLQQPVLPPIMLQEAQSETARELADVLRIAQEMGQRLSKETHGDLYDDVRELNENLRDLRQQLDVIVAALPTP